MSISAGGEDTSPARVFWSAPPLWEGETAFVLAGGASLRDFDASVLRSRKVMAIKESCLLAPWAPLLFFADNCWFERERDLVDAFAGDVISVAAKSHGSRCKVMRRGRQLGISDDPAVLNGSWTSVHYALGLLKHFKVARIALLGMDLTGGRWHDRNPFPPSPVNVIHMHAALASTAAPLAAARVEVFNCTPGGKLTVWPRRPLSDLL
jgi:hypothetical protein